VFIGAIVGVVVVVGLVAAALLRRRSNDDVHSVEHYHRSLHTLEEMRTHLPVEGQNGNGDAAFPATAFRLSGSSTVRLTEPSRVVVPPVPPPPVANPTEPVQFDDEAGSEPVPAAFMAGGGDRAMHSINRRPRRLGAPLAAVAAVTVLIVVLVVTGMHSNTPAHSGRHSGAATTPGTGPHPSGGSRHPTTTTSTAPPAVSAPTGATAHSAIYQVAAANYTLAFAATTGECWVQATSTATGSVLFSGTLFAGQSNTVAATGPVTVIAGAPNAFSATVDGAAVTIPPGYQAPFTLTFQTVSG
jgi:hypothetical protein